VRYWAGAVAQRIRFIAVGGHRVAYSTLGEGAPLVVPGPWLSHLQLDMEREPIRDFAEQLGAGRTVIRYDRLGSGMSDRDRPPAPLTLETDVWVLESLIDQLDLRSCSLFGIGYGGCVAMAYAASRPERVSRLVLYGAFADGGAICPVEVQRSMVSLVRAHWGMGSRVLSEMFFRDGDPAWAAWFARLQRASVSADTAAAMLELVYRVDIRHLLPEIRVPALVLHRRGDRTIPFRLGREVAALLPQSHFVPLEGQWYHFWEGDTRAILTPVLEFLAIPQTRTSGAQPAPVGQALSRREVQVLRLVAEGLSDRQIAWRLTLSPHTVHRHVSNVRRKLLQPSRAAAAASAARQGLI